MLREIEAILRRREPDWARELQGTLLSSWLAGAKKVLEGLPQDTEEALTGETPPGEKPTFEYASKAADDLFSRKVLTPQEYVQLDELAQEKAFTIARVASADVIERLRDAIAENIQSGGDLRDFRGRAQQAIAASGLSPSQVEATYRTTVAVEYARAQDEVVRKFQDDLPFVVEGVIDDSRTSELCRAVLRGGLQGTNIYLVDDPEYQRIRSPRHVNCRCTKVYIGVEDAARRGIKYAQQWLRTGVRPPAPRIRRLPIEMPKGWTR